MQVTRILSLWQRLAPLPGGKWLFSRAVGWMVPYSGTIGAEVVQLEPGHALLNLSDRRAVRNHLESIHAVALTNLGELTSGLAMLTAIAPEVRGIVVALRVEFSKKARGTLRSESRATPPHVDQPTDADVVATITDHAGDLVATITVTWRLTPAAMLG